MNVERSSFLAALGSAVLAAAPAAAADSGTVWHVAIFRFASAHVPQALDGFRTMRAASRRHPGNLAYDVFRSPDDPGTFFISERWVSAAALAAHEATPVFANVGRNVLVRYAELHDSVTGEMLA